MWLRQIPARIDDQEEGRAIDVFHGNGLIALTLDVKGGRGVNLRRLLVERSPYVERLDPIWTLSHPFVGMPTDYFLLSLTVPQNGIEACQLADKQIDGSRHLGKRGVRRFECIARHEPVVANARLNGEVDADGVINCARHFTILRHGGRLYRPPRTVQAIYILIRKNVSPRAG